MLIRKSYTNNISAKLLGYTCKGLTLKNEQFFISGLIREYGAKKILEVGVAAGGSSLVILDALNGEGKLYSHDYSATTSKLKKPTGYFLDYVPELKQNWTLKTGGMCCNYLDEFCADGEKFDLCFLDTAHRNPGEFLDFLQILPYMKKGGILILHDISLHTQLTRMHNTTCCTLFSAIKGQKILPSGDFFVNIGAIILDENIMDSVYDIFNCLRLPWQYEINEQDIAAVRKCLKRFYSEDMIELFDAYCNFRPVQSTGRFKKLYRFIKAVKNNSWI